MAEYMISKEVEKLAKQLIKHAHQRLKHVELVYLMRDKATKSHGNTVLGKAKRVGGLTAFLADPVDYMVQPTPFFVIEIAQDMWQQLDDDQKLALVDHELCHCHVDYHEDGTPILSIQGHDYEEFAQIIERHGFWLASDQKISKAVQTQLVLAVDEVTTYVGHLAADPDIDTATGEILTDPRRDQDDQG